MMKTKRKILLIPIGTGILADLYWLGVNAEDGLATIYRLGYGLTDILAKHTINEDIADLGGFEIAFQTYTDHLTSHGFHGDELRRQQWLFYQAYAHIWRARYTDAYAQERVTGDIHSLPRERVNALVPHTDAWYDLFNVKPGDNLYIAPENRVHIW